MAERKANIAYGLFGMNRTGFGHQLDEKAYTFQLNGNLETDEMGGLALTNEHSNLLCSRFKPGYKVIGTKFDVNSDRVYFFLTNPTTKQSEIGYIEYFHYFEDDQDVLKECNCTYESILAQPLENQTQIEGCEYHTLLSDCEENNFCLNFNIRYPIKKIALKGEKFFKTLYWTDNLNPPRYLQLQNLEQYKYNGEDVCGEIVCGDGVDVENPQTIEDCATCLDCEKLRIFKRFSIPHIEPTILQFGGNLRMGSYEFLVAYSDRLGNEVSEYFSITNPISIFDHNNYILTQPQLADRTNMSIVLDVSNLDKDFQYFKVVVIQRADINGETSQFVEGVHPITDTTIIYSTEVDKPRITLQEIFAQKPVFKTWQGLTESNNYLFGYGYTVEKEWNLQPVVSLMGSFLKWQTHQASENLYRDGVAASKYRGYMRDETYPFGIRFGTKDGYWTSIFPFIGRPATQEEQEDIVFESNGNLVTGDRNAASILDNAPDCATTDRKKKWQYFNTAELEGYCVSYDLEDFDTVVRTTIETSKVKICTVDPLDPRIETCTDVIDTIPAGTIILPIYTSDFKGLKNWFKENKDLIRVCCGGTICPESEEPEGECPESSDCTPGGGFPDLICDLATNDYTDLHAEPSLPFGSYEESVCEECTDEDELSFNQCLVPTLVECSEDIPYPQDVFIKQVHDETYRLQEKLWTTEYERTLPFGTPSVYIESSVNGGDYADAFYSDRLVDFWFFDGGGSDSDNNILPVLKRMSEMLYNDSCSTASDIFEKEYSSFVYFFDYMFTDAECLTEDYSLLQSEFPSAPFSTTPTINTYNCDIIVGEPPAIVLSDAVGFTNKIHKKALWFKISTEDLRFINEGEEPSVIVEVTKAQTDFLESYDDDDLAFFERRVVNDYYRITILDSCSPTDANILHSEILHKDTGWWRMFKESDFDSENIFIVLDSPINTIVWRSCINDNPRPYQCSEFEATFHAITPLNGAINVIKRYKEYKCAEITHNGIDISKRESYEATCRYIIPHLNDCVPSPYQHGKFAYWESQEEYPNNEDLYNSSKLIIHPDDIPEYIQEEFEDYFVDGYTDLENYHLKEDTDFRCKPIRHFKFPDNIISPFIFDQPTSDASDTIIYPIGVTIDDQVIHTFLDIAEKNGLITKEQRASITDYEIYRGDRTIHKSVLYKGIANDMYRYFERGTEKWFRNFPFNSLGENQYLYENNFQSRFIQHPYENEGNNKFSILAPEVYYSQPTGATEVVTEGYQMGYADGLFKEEDGHSKWVILGDRAKDLASTLATLEVSFEAAINIGEGLIGMATSMWSGWTAFSWGFGFAIAGHVIITAANIISSMLFKYARYKYEWLEIFKNNGTPYNFAHRFVGTGKYNYFYANKEEESYIRGLNTGKYIKPGNAIINDEHGKNIIRVNNIERETSFFVSFGQEYNITYPTRYVNWDNTDKSQSSSSRYLSSDEGCDDSISIRKIASPYMSIKTYSPAQYGTIDSVKWLPINHDTKLKKDSTEQNTCKEIFGGDVFISRVAFKNKFPFFLVNAMELPNRTPFDYFLYSNIGSARYFASYETPITQVEQGRPIPYADTIYNFNCPEEDVDYTRDFYLKPTNNRQYKFYLHSFGVPYFFVESTINSEYRYAGVEPHEQFYPNVDVLDWTEERKNSIMHNNTYRYNSAYSKDVTPNGARTLPAFYNTKEWNELYNYPNGVVWSQQDNSEQDLRDPWLVYRPLDKYQFSYEYGKLIDLSGIESYQVFGRFENNALVFNAIDTLADRVTVDTWTLGTGGIFATRPTEFSNTELGETGTQHTDFITTEFGHFWTDAKRGKVFQLQPNAKGLLEISGFKRDGSPSGMRQWFKRHLPFKILKNRKVEGLDETSFDLDNKYNSLGINMWWDSKFKRLFITKRDKIIDDPCIKYSDEIGFYIDETECNGEEPIKSCPLGYTYNPDTEMCEKEFTATPCRTGYEFNPLDNTCTKQETTEPEIEEEIITTITCEEGYTYNPTTEMCERIEVVPTECPEGYTYDEKKGVCVLEGPCDADIVLVIDNSSSINETEYEQMMTFCRNFVQSFQAQIEAGTTRIGIVKFHDCAEATLNFSDDFSTIQSTLQPPRIGGPSAQTNVSEGLCFAKDMIDNFARPSTLTRVYLFLDGVQNTPGCSTCGETYEDPDQVHLLASQLRLQGVDTAMIITGEEFERDEVKDWFIFNYPPVPSSGTGIGGTMSWESSFSNLPAIINEVVESMGTCTNQTPLICPNGCTSIPDTDLCSCFSQTEPTIEEEIVTHYSCPEGWTFNERDLVCERTITEQGCGDECTVSIEGCNCTEQVDPIIDTIKTPVDPTTFKDVSWTVSYSPIYDSWVSYYSFTPDYAVSFNDYFQTGHNNEEDKRGVWSHLLTNKSFQVFYGKKYNWEIEIPFKNEYVSKVLEAVNISTETYRYHNEFDFAHKRKQSFNTAIIFNSTNNTGKLWLNYSDAADDHKYPIQIDKISQEIKATHHKGTVRFNYFFNRVADENSNIPVWIWDENEIIKTLNPLSLTYTKKNPLERMRGNMFRLHLTQNSSTQYKQLYKWSLGKEHIDLF